MRNFKVNSLTSLFFSLFSLSSFTPGTRTQSRAAALLPAALHRPSSLRLLPPRCCLAAPRHHDPTRARAAPLPSLTLRSAAHATLRRSLDDTRTRRTHVATPAHGRQAPDAPATAPKQPNIPASPPHARYKRRPSPLLTSPCFFLPAARPSRCQAMRRRARPPRRAPCPSQPRPSPTTQAHSPLPTPPP